jgi:hypothetical protein
MCSFNCHSLGQYDYTAKNWSKMFEITYRAVISSKTWSEESEKSEARSFKDWRALCLAGRLRRLVLLAGMVDAFIPHI